MPPAGVQPIIVALRVSGPGVETVSPPNSFSPKSGLILRQPLREGRPARFVPPRRPGDIEEIPVRLCALGGEVGQVHPQQLARDQVRRIIGEEMHAFHQGIGGDDKVVARPGW